MRRPEVLLAFAVSGLIACRACRSHEPLPGDATAVAPSGCVGDPVSERGEATYYDADGGGSCSFEPSPGDLMVAALDGFDYRHAAWCGACLAVSGPRGEVIVRVVDRCSGCKPHDLDLGRQAFEKIAPLSAGRVPIAWREVACPVTGPIAYQLKPGSNPQWTAIQVRDHRYAIAELAVRGRAGAYEPIARADDNYFIAPHGLGAGPYALRVTDVHGQVLEDRGIALGVARPQPGAAQLPSCRQDPRPAPAPADQER
jgi:expansin (peptidoglycan-binding protein)